MSTADRIVDKEQAIQLNEDEELQSLEIEEEVDEVVDETPEEEEVSTLPEKFKGKTAEEIAESYLHVEKELGRKNNEVGELRKLADDFIRQQLSVDNSPTSNAVKEKNVDVDTLLDDPTKAINDVVDDNPRLKALEDELRKARIAENKKAFESKHADWQDLLATEDFQKWVTQSTVRQKMLIEADRNYDYDVADELFSLYKQVRGVAVTEAKEKAETKRKAGLKKAGGERSNSGATTKKVFLRKDLIRMKIEDPQRYEAMEPDILKAYQEGRVR